MAMMTLHDVHGVFVDALLTDDAEGLIFLSIWGRDTAIRELQARITLGATEGGLTSLSILEQRPEGIKKHLVRLISNDMIEQLTGRVRKNILGDIVHCWLYHRDIVKPDKANCRALLINQHDQFDSLWQVVKLICPVPVMDHWKELLLVSLEAKGMITRLCGINQFGVRIAIDESAVERMVKDFCHEGRLTVV